METKHQWTIEGTEDTFASLQEAKKHLIDQYANGTLAQEGVVVITHCIDGDLVGFATIDTAGDFEETYSELFAVDRETIPAPLEGSEEEIAEAEPIREAAYRCLDTLKDFVHCEEADAIVRRWETAMDGKTEASWWLSHQDELPTDPSTEMAGNSAALFHHLFG